MDFKTGQVGGREHWGKGLSREIWRRATNGRASEQYFYWRGLDEPRVGRQSDRAEFRGDDLVGSGQADGRSWCRQQAGNAVRERAGRPDRPRARGRRRGSRHLNRWDPRPSGRGGAATATRPCRTCASRPTSRTNSILVFTPARKTSRVIERALTQLDRPKCELRHRRHDR